MSASCTFGAFVSTNAKIICKVFRIRTHSLIVTQTAKTRNHNGKLICRIGQINTWFFNQSLLTISNLARDSFVANILTNIIFDQMEQQKQNTITGKIISVMDERSGISKNGSAWRQREYVLQEQKDKYPQRCIFRVKGENIEKFSLNTGDVVTAYLDIDAHEFQGRWYNEVTAWKVEKGGAQ